MDTNVKKNNQPASQLQPAGGGEIVLYQPDNNIRLEVQLDPDSQTVWLSQAQIGQLYGKAKSTISEHLTHIFEEGELNPQVVVRENRTTTRHGAIEDKTQDNITRFYNLDAIIAVGLRVRSKQGTLFRRWAIERLKNYIVKGFDIDSERLKGNGGGQYWYELLNTIKDIRSSEKVLYRQVLDLYALTTMPQTKRPYSFSKWCRTNFTMPPTDRPQPKSSSTVPMPKRNSWDSPPSVDFILLRPMSPLPRTTSAKPSFANSTIWCPDTSTSPRIAHWIISPPPCTIIAQCSTASSRPEEMPYSRTLAPSLPNKPVQRLLTSTANTKFALLPRLSKPT